jgi:ribosomal peptide maturation radical SAM protein 1
MALMAESARGEGAEAVDVLLVVPPFATTEFPMLGPGLLAAACRRAGVRARVEYANLHMAARLGFGLYERIALSSLRVMLGELLFRPHVRWTGDPAAPPTPREAVAHLPHEVRVSGAYPAITAAEVDAALEAVPGFLDGCAERILASGARIVGFSSAFQQTLASVALAQRVKAAGCGVVTAYGGANADHPMGAALARITDTFDHIFSGEADDDFPAFCAAFLREGAAPEPGVHVCTPVENLETVPYPDLDDYFRTLEALRGDGKLPDFLPRSIPIEFSRGCWWGQKHHCTFCGLNARGMAHRSKGGPRALDEMRHLVRRHGVWRLQCVDNIMPVRFPQEFLPEAAKDRVTFFFEVKANLSAADLDVFVHSGVMMIQPGIESLSSAVLRQIRKGVSAAQNVSLLRNCRSRGIDVSWNMLVAVPNDEAGEYEAMLAFLPLLEHLQPPQGCHDVVLDRFSPYFQDPREFGIGALRPFEAYAHLYPPGPELDSLAYHFHGDFPSGYRDTPGLRERFEGAVQGWADAWADESQVPPRLYGVGLDDGSVFVEDTRRVARGRFHKLTPEEAVFLRALDVPRRPGRMPPDEAPLLEMALDRGFVAVVDGLLLNLVTWPEDGPIHGGDPEDAHALTGSAAEG